MVIEFLKEAIIRVTEKKLDFIPRAQNLDFLREEGLTIIDIEDIICALTKNDYFRGPLLDRDNSKEDVWVFKKNINNKTVYIKLKLRQYKDKERIDDVVCLSMHEDKK